MKKIIILISILSTVSAFATNPLPPTHDQTCQTEAEMIALNSMMKSCELGDGALFSVSTSEQETKMLNRSYRQTTYWIGTFAKSEEGPQNSLLTDWKMYTVVMNQNYITGVCTLAQPIELYDEFGSH